jgi:hypothetical protein
VELILNFSHKCGEVFGRPSQQWMISSSKLKLYIYCANVKPTDPDFEKKGGAVYIVGVYSGFIERDLTGEARETGKDEHGSVFNYWFLDRSDFALTTDPELSTEFWAPRVGTANPDHVTTCKHITALNPPLLIFLRTL